MLSAAPRLDRPLALPLWAWVTAIAWGPAVLTFGRVTGAVRVTSWPTLAGLALLLSGAAVLSAWALRRHQAATAAATSRNYLVRHAGLIWGVGVGGALVAHWLGLPGGRSWGHFAADYVFLATLHAPIMLWSGTWWHSGVRRSLGGGAPDDPSA